MEHLIELGHRRIGYVSVSNRPRSNTNRLKGYRRALKVAGISYDAALVYDSVATTDHAQRGRDSLAMMQAHKATAVFCYNDMCAIGLIAACHQAGVRVPDDISVVGFDDIDLAQHAQPPLTTIHQPRYELGESAMRMMLGLLNGEPQRNHIFAAELVVRQSAGLLR
jgi:DNA-binding LacI/PurR family transcriptional regulator